MKKLYEQVRALIEKVNVQYKQKASKNHPHLEFKPSDLMWFHLTKETLLSKRKSKLMARGDGPYNVVQNVGENAYKIELLRDMQISATVDIRDLTPYLGDKTMIKV